MLHWYNVSSNVSNVEQCFEEHDRSMPIGHMTTHEKCLCLLDDDWKWKPFPFAKHRSKLKLLDLDNMASIDEIFYTVRGNEIESEFGTEDRFMQLCENVKKISRIAELLNVDGHPWCKAMPEGASRTVVLSKVVYRCSEYDSFASYEDQKMYHEGMESQNKKVVKKLLKKRH